MRLIFAIWAAKLSSIVSTMFGKKSSTLPGVVALKICPDLIQRLCAGISKEIIVISGTNGKTSVNNFLYTALINDGCSVVCNNIGANMLGGIAAAFVKSASVFGKFHADYGCFEIDEAACFKVFDKLKPTCFVILNLFRDQLDRYGEIDAIVNLLENSINKIGDVRLVLNADDPLTAQFGLGRKNVTYFGIAHQVLPACKETKESSFCVICNNKITYDYFHYSQLGDYHCDSCGYKRPHTDVFADNIILNNFIEFDVNQAHIKINYKGFYNIYNVISAIAVLKSLKISCDNFCKTLNECKQQIGRMEEFYLEKSVILNLVKNPAGFNQTISTILNDNRKKDIIVAINDCINDGRDVSWLWDVSFERLVHGNLNFLFAAGERSHDVNLRFKYSNMPVIEVGGSIKKAILKSLRESQAEVCYILVNYTLLFTTQRFLAKLAAKRKENKS